MKIRVFLAALMLAGISQAGASDARTVDFGPAWPTVSVSDPATSTPTTDVLTGADQLDLYLPMLKGKRVALLANYTSVINNKPSVDVLLQHGVDIKVIFGPEHGFRGNASNGAEVTDEIDPATSIPIISLYGAKAKPSRADLENIDIVVFDLQDVGCRFYTKINKLRDIMEACAENQKKLLILDRPNPNDYVDGPILEMENKSGIGQFPIPITHGMTIGEFARMLNGEGWLENKAQCEIEVIPVKNWRHGDYYVMPIFPSPNLNTQESVILYPTLCLFEGTILSQGRGTEFPFTVLGSPALKGMFDFSFMPRSLPGKAEAPLHMDEICYGVDFRKADLHKIYESGKVNIQVMMKMYQAYPEKSRFFDSSYNKAMGQIYKLAGTKKFQQQIESGASEEEIRRSWEPGLSEYKKMREKYLLYPTR